VRALTRFAVLIGVEKLFLLQDDFIEFGKPGGNLRAAVMDETHLTADSGWFDNGHASFSESVVSGAISDLPF
jgi:hypothetical protein